MAVAIHSSTPAAVSSDTAVSSLTTAAFTPPVDALLLMVAIFDTATSTRTGTPTTVTGSTSTWTTVGNYNNGNGTTGGLIHISWARVATSQSTTVRVTWPASNDCAMKVWVLTGVPTVGNPIGASGSATYSTNPQTVSYAATTAGSQGFLGLEDFSQAGTKTISNTATEVTLSSNSNGLISRDSAVSGSAGQTRSFSISGTPGGASVGWVEVIAASAATGSSVVFRGATEDARGTTNSPVPVLPAGVVEGDLLLAVQTCDLNGSLASMTAPTGWAQVGSGSRSDVGFMKVWQKTATAGDLSGSGVATTGGSGGSQTDRTSVSYTNSAGTTSTGHIYAGGLDWTKRVGILVYTDGSGEFGLANTSSTYLLAGTNGLIAIAKKHNMVLVTPRAPGNGCTDGDGVCWYLASNDGTPLATKTKWADDFIRDQVLTKYDIDTSRAVIAGYSSGAQFTMEYYGPQYASAWMTDGLLLGISYGGSPKVTANYPTAFKQNVAASWDVGDQDPSYQSSGAFGVQAGYDWYTNNGFTATELTVVAGEDHARDGQFGAIVDREVTQYVTAADAGSTTLTFTDSTGSQGSAIVIAAGGQNTSAPLAITPTFSSGASATAHPAPSVAGVSGGLLVTAHLAGTAGTSRTYTAPSGLSTAKTSVLSSSPNILTGAYYQSLSAAGQTGTKSATCSGSAPYVTMSLVIAPVTNMVTVTPDAADATGSAGNATARSTSLATSNSAGATGKANNPTVSAANRTTVSAGRGSATGAANNPSVTTSSTSNTTVTAGLAGATGAALGSNTGSANGFQVVTQTPPGAAGVFPSDTLFPSDHLFPSDGGGAAPQTVTAVGIGTAEAFGFPVITVADGPQTVQAVGIPSSEAFGVPTVAPDVGPQTVTAVGIDTAEAFGRPTVAPDVAPPLPTPEQTYFDTYYVDGVDLSTYTTQIEVAEGLQDTPGTVGDNVVLPGRDGALEVFSAPGQPRRPDGVGRLTLDMWLIGVDPLTGELVDAAGSAQSYLSRWDELVRMFHRRRILVDHPRPDGTRRALAHLVPGESMSPSSRLASPWFGRFRVSLAIPGAYWDDLVEVTTGPTSLSTNGVLSLSPWSAATAPCTELIVTFGSGNNPRLSTSYGFVGYNGTIAPGRQLAINTTTGELGPGGGALWTPPYDGLIYSPGPRLFEIDPAEPLQAILTHTGGGVMSVEVAGKRRYRTS